MARFGVRPPKLLQYPGLKEEYYLHDFEPDQSVLAELFVNRERTLVVVRTPPDVSLYHRRSNPFFPKLLAHLGHEKSVQAVVLPRSPEQRDYVRELSLPSLIVPDTAVDAQSLIALADLVVSAGGTMNREAAALGVPVYTTYGGRIGGVDEMLIREGRLRPLTDPRALELESEVANPPRGAARSRFAPGPPADCARGRLDSPPQATSKGRVMRKRLLVRCRLRGGGDGGRRAAGGRRQRLRIPHLGAGDADAARTGSSVKPIISVGDSVRGYRFEAIPDGISFTRNGRGTMDVYVNHETSLVAFPANRSDFTNSLVSKLRLNQHSAGVLRGEYVIGNDANYQRFCSNFLVGEEHGFERELLLTNEEARDIVLRQGYAWHPPFVSLDEPFAEQAGVVVALDTKSGAYRSIYGMGRHNHENDVGVPGYGHPVVLSGDDTFDAPASQMYMYSAASGSALWNDEGTLYAFVADDPNVNDYGDFPAANGASGHFVEVPPMIASGKKPDGTRCPLDRLRVSGTADGDSRRAAVGARALEPQRRARAPVHPDRGHRLRPDDQQRRVLRRHG